MQRNLLLIISVVIVLSSACASKQRLPSGEAPDAKKKPAVASAFKEGQVIEGTASYYGKKHHGRQTASGEVFDMNALTAAHRTLPFGTLIEVENLDNGEKVQVTINDRGPYVGKRILDLSYGAAKDIHMVKSGLATVKITILELAE